MELYDRNLKLIVYTRPRLGSIIKDLHMDFEIDLTSSKDPNVATFSVYNASPGMRNKFSEDHQALEFFAGYGDSPILLFRGNTKNVYHEKSEVDYKTIIIAGDGEKEYKTKKFSQSFPAGTPITQILRAVCATMGLPASVGGLIDTDTITASESYDGLCKDIIDGICKDFDLEWCISYGTIEFRLRGSMFPKDVSVLRIGPKSGLLEPPTVYEYVPEGHEKKSRKGTVLKLEKIKWGVKLRTLLLPMAKPGRAMKFTYSSLNLDVDMAKTDISNLRTDGIYLIKSVKHIGSNYDNNYYSEIDAELTL